MKFGKGGSFCAGDLGVLAEALGAEAVVAAVHRKLGPGDERGVVAQEKEGGAGHLHRVAHAVVRFACDGSGILLRLPRFPVQLQASCRTVKHSSTSRRELCAS